MDGLLGGLLDRGPVLCRFLLRRFLSGLIPELCVSIGGLVHFLSRVHAGKVLWERHSPCQRFCTLGKLTCRALLPHLRQRAVTGLLGVLIKHGYRCEWFTVPVDLHPGRDG